MEPALFFKLALAMPPFDDCLVKGSGLDGAIKNPGTLDSVRGCLERWFTAPAAAGP